jgi:hypothetical protein
MWRERGEPMDDFFSRYLEYAGVGTSEAPTIFHRWSIVSAVGAMLGRQIHLPFGHSKIYPNQYIMIMGSPGSRKSTAMAVAKGLLQEAGYTRFGPDKTSKERFLMEMKQYEEAIDMEDLEALTLDEPSEIYVVASEFTDFVGTNNMEFITMLTNLWDNPDVYRNPKIHGASVLVHEPTVNIIGGNTTQGFALAFPPESLGNGFLSRLIFVYGEPNGVKVAWPKPSDPLLAAGLVEDLKQIKVKAKGIVTLGKGVEELGDKIYREFRDIDDARFKHYSTRRFTHLIKLSMVIAATRMSTQIQEEDMLKANTLLHYTEHNMPKALGEFGKSKYSDVSNQILEKLNHSLHPVGVNELWRLVDKDLPKMQDLIEVLKNLVNSDKIQFMGAGKKQGYVTKHNQKVEWDRSLLMEEWLREEEKL